MLQRMSQKKKTTRHLNNSCRKTRRRSHNKTNTQTSSNIIKSLSQHSTVARIVSISHKNARKITNQKLGQVRVLITHLTNKFRIVSWQKILEALHPKCLLRHPICFYILPTYNKWIKSNWSPLFCLFLTDSEATFSTTVLQTTNSSMDKALEEVCQFPAADINRSATKANFQVFSIKQIKGRHKISV